MHYWLQDNPDNSTRAILGQIPSRWGRMDAISRLAVVEIGRLLREEGMLGKNSHVVSESLRVGLIAGTEFGSLATDLAYARNLKIGDLVSPHLFGYTLANIPLAEAAVHYRLRGPVYSVYSKEPFAEAIREAIAWIQNDASVDFMVAGALNYYPAELGSSPGKHRNSHFKLLSHANNNHNLSLLAEDS